MDSAWDSGQFGGGVVEHVWMSDGLMFNDVTLLRCKWLAFSPRPRGGGRSSVNRIRVTL